MNSISEICKAISLLFDTKSNSESILQENESLAVQLTFIQRLASLNEHVTNSSELLVAVTRCAPAVLQGLENSDPEWRFVEWNLVLLSLLGEALRKAKTPGRTDLSEALAVDALSIQQQKDVLRCVQTIVALGIYPGLIPGVGVPLEIRSGFKDLVKESWTFCERHRRLVTCSSVLIETVKDSSSLSAIVLSHHLGDILTALIQLCHAPIKKCNSSKLQLTEQSTKFTDDPSNLAQVFGAKSEVPACSKSNSLQDMLLMCSESSTLNNEEGKLIAEMWEDRYVLSAELEHLTNTVCQSLLVRELLTIQSCSLVNSASSKKRASGHGWLRKTCGFMLTNCLIRRGGVLAVIEGLLESDIASGDGEWTKYEAVAKLIAHAPLQSTSVRDYYREIGHQVVTLLKMKNLLKEKVLLRIVTTIVLHLSLGQHALMAEMIFKPLLRPFLSCCNRISVSDEEEIVSSEEVVMEAVDILHKIFVLGVEPNALLFSELLFVFFPLFSLLVDTQGGVSYLRSNVTDLMVTLLTHNENASDLLLAAAFGNETLMSKRVASGIYFRHGSKGGIEIVTSRQPVFDDWLSEDSSKAAVILELVKALNDSKLSAKFFLLLLQQLTTVVGEPEIATNVVSENNYLEIVSTEQEMSAQLRQNLLLLSLLQDLSGIVGDSLLDDRLQALSFIKVTLERGSQSRDFDGDFRESTLLLSMGVLAMLLVQKEQLKSEDWKAFSTLLPVLSKLSSGHYGERVENLAEELTVTIATRGTVSARTKTSGVDATPFTRAVREAQSDFVPEQGHGLIVLKRLLQNRDDETIREKDQMIKILEEKLKETDSYVYLIAIQVLVSLADMDPLGVITLLSEKFVNCSTHETELRMKIGEVLMQICRNLGEMAPRYGNVLLNTFLHGTKDKDEHIRSSSLSSLGELCKCLRFALGPCLQEVLLCLRSVLRTDPFVQARRAAGLVTTLLLRGLGSDALTLMETEMRDLYRQLKLTYETDNDDVVRLHAQLSLEEINSVMLKLFTHTKHVTKEIRILDPF